MLDTNRHTVRSRLLRWGFACAAAVPFLSGCLTSSAAQGVRSVDVIPAPARVAFSDGVFAVRASTSISIPRDPGVARIARYFAGLMEETRGVRLSLVERSNDSLPEGAIVLRLDPSGVGANPESYAIEVTPRRILLSAGDPRGLFYAAVTLWQLATSGTSTAGPVVVDRKSVV